MKPQLIYSALFFILAFLSGFSQKFNLQKFSIKEGLVESTVKQIEEDNYGNLWLATNNGLSKFNGKLFENYSTSNGLPSNEISSLLFKNDVLYIGTKNGFCSYNGNSIVNKAIYKKIHGNVKKILAKNTELHIITTEGYFILNTAKDEPSLDSVSMSHIISHNPTDAELDEDGNVWIATSRRGLFFVPITISTKIPKFILIQNSSSPVNFQGKKIRTVSFNASNILRGQTITSIEFDSNKNLLISDWNNGIARLKFDNINNNEFTPEYLNFAKTLTNGSIINRFINIQKDIDGKLFFFTDGFGLVVIPIDNNTHENDFSESQQFWVSSNEGFFGNNPLCFIQDKFKNTWIGTLYDGVVLLKAKRSLKYNQDAGGLKEEKVISVFKSSDSSIWVGSHGGGAFKFKNKKFTRCFWEQGISESIIKSITEDNAANIWLGTNGGGISIIPNYNIGKDLKVSKVIKEVNGLTSDYISFLFKAKDGSIWVGHDDQNKIDKITIQADLTVSITSFLITKLVSFNVSCITEDDKHNIWITSSEGVWVLNTKTEKINQDYSSFKNIQTIAKDWNGNMWLGSSDVGAIILKNNLKVPYFEKGIANSIEKLTEEKNGISSNRINTILFAKDVAWFVSNNGINEVKIDTYLNKIKEVKPYNKDLGFASYDNKPNTAVFDDQKLIWIGSVEGLTHFQNLNKKTDEIDTTSIAVFINSISIDNKEIDWTNDSLFKSNGEYESIKFDGFFNWNKIPNHLKLDHKHNSIKFTVNTDNIAEQAQINYSYKLQGLDNDWILLDKNLNEIKYQGLSDGEYTLIIRASLATDFSNAKEYEYGFIVTPPFWKTKAFFIAVIIIIILLLYFFIVTRERLLKNEKLKLELEVKARTSEIEHKKEEIELQNSLIQGINNDLTDSIKYAHRIQQTILPNISVWSNYFSDHFLFYKPRNIVSGDYYWMKELDGLIYIAVVDCTGHGVPGAFMSLITSSVLNEAVSPSISKNKPVKILRYLRKEMNARLSLNNGEQINDGMDISLICFDKNNNTVEYVNANRPLYVISDNELTIIPSEKVTIGGYADFVSMIPSKIINVKPGDSVFMFSDGITDQFGGPKNKKYNPSRLREFLLSHNHLPFSEVRDDLSKDLSDWQGTYEQTDDILLIGLKV